MKRTEMINVKDILRCRRGLGLMRDEIAAAVGVSAGTVSNVLKRAEAAGLSRWPLQAQFGPICALLREAGMRYIRNPQMTLGEVHIENIELDPKSRDDIPALLTGLQHLCADEHFRSRLFAVASASP